MDPVDTLFNQKLKPVDFNLIRKEVYDYCGIKITPVKKQMVKGRLRRRLKALGMHSYEDYCDFVFRKRDQHDDDEFIHLVDAITTNKTEFFREPVLGIGETLNKLANICFGMTDDGLKLASVSNFNTVGATAEKQSFIEGTRAIFAEVTSHVAKSMESLSEGG